MKNVLLLFALFYCFNATGQDTLNVMSYNLYRFPEKPPINRELILREIMNSYHPDVLMTCELMTEDGANRILNTSLNSNSDKYKRAIFVPIQSENSDSLQQMVFYNNEKLTLMQQKTYPTKVRDINHYTFLLNTTDVYSDTVFLEVFVAHLKSSEGAANRQLRSGMVDTFFEKLKSIPKNHHVLFGGDFNFYSAYNEPAYQKLVDTKHAFVMVDPIHMPGKWHDNDTFKAIHTQATRLSTEGFGTGGASGGMDDRFDFIMMSKSLEGNGPLSYIPGSYKAYGNNGNCLNNRVDAYDCDGPYSLALRQNLYKMSDHLPVVMQLKTEKQFAVGINTVTPEAGIVFLSGNMIKNRLILKFNDRQSGNEISICNNLGQVLFKRVIKADSGVFELDISSFNNGVYYLHLTGKVNGTYKFVKI